MCLILALQRPDDVLEHKKLNDYEYMILHNGVGFRCGYVKLPLGRPWHGMSIDEINAVGVNMRGGCSFANADTSCNQPGEDDGWWIGFDCAHADDGFDDKLPLRSDNLYPPGQNPVREVFGNGLLFPGQIKDNDYLRAECASIINQAIESAEITV